MKGYKVAIITMAISVLIWTGCTEDFNQQDVAKISNKKIDTIHFTHSMKGWELYSWPIGSQWKFSLLPGTNRIKTEHEVISNTICVIGTDSIKAILYKMPAGEEIFWAGSKWIESCWKVSQSSISLPQRSIQIEIKEFCDTHNLKLYIAE